MCILFTGENLRAQCFETPPWLCEHYRNAFAINYPWPTVNLLIAKEAFLAKISPKINAIDNKLLAGNDQQQSKYEL